MKKIFVMFFAFLALCSVIAQTKFPLIINCNQMDADLYINNRLYTKTVPNLRIQLPPNVYNIKISKAGFLDFNANVTVKASGTENLLSVVLQPAQQVQAPATVQAPNSIVPSFPLRVVCNVQGAQILVDGKMVGATPNDVQILLGNHEVRVVYPGFADVVQMVNVKGMVSINAMFQAQNQQLSVNSNINGASVLINGNPAGQTPFMAQMPNGSYTVIVRAPGYMDFSQNIVINGGPLQVNAMLQGQNQQLSVQCNVNGADVYINGNPAGKTPMMAQVPQGSYSIQVKAPGYGDFGQNVVVGNGPATVNAMLQPMLASWQLKLPDSMLNKDIKSGQSRGIQVWVDGTLQAETLGPIVAAGQFFPGRHSVRVVSGGLAVETQVDAQAGRAYSIEPFIGINVK